MRKVKLRKFFLIGLFTAAFILLVFLIQTFGIEPLRSAVKEMGFWAPLGILLLRGISVILPALPSSVYSLFPEFTNLSLPNCSRSVARDTVSMGKSCRYTPR